MVSSTLELLSTTDYCFPPMWIWIDKSCRETWISGRIWNGINRKYCYQLLIIYFLPRLSYDDSAWWTCDGNPSIGFLQWLYSWKVIPWLSTYSPLVIQWCYPPSDYPQARRLSSDDYTILCDNGYPPISYPAIIPAPSDYSPAADDYILNIP